MISIIIPVHKEPAILPLLDHLEQLKGNKEIIIVDGEGGAIQEIRKKNIKLLTSKPGRAQQMNKGAQLAQDDILLFLHADTHLPNNALLLINEASKHYNAGAFNLGFTSNKLIYRTIAKVSTWRSRITRVPYGDQAQWFRKEFFQKINGYPEGFMEDLRIMKKVKQAGDKIRIINSTVKTSPRRWEQQGIIKNTLKNWIVTVLYYLGLKAETLKRVYNRL